MENDEILMERIIKFSKEFYKKLDFAHNIEHGERTAKIAKMIMKKEGGNPFLVEAGAWLHQFHNNLEEVERFIYSLDLENDLKTGLAEIARCRPSKISETSTLEAKIVFDADAIEVLGAYGTIRELLCNIKARNKNWEDTVNDTIRVQNIFRDKLMTNAAKELVSEELKLMDAFWNNYNKWIQI